MNSQWFPLSAPSLKVVRVPKDLDPQCLRILEERKDWMIEAAK